MAIAFVLLVALTLGACGGSGAEGGPVVVRVGDFTIGKATVDRWALAIARGRPAGGLGGRAGGAPRQRALASLISAGWLRGEAAAEGVAASSKAVDRALSERKEANGSAEFEESLHASGQTLADVRLEVEAELDAAAIRRKSAAATPPVTEAEVIAYYRAKRGMFRTPEVRRVDLLESLPSRAAATALVARIGTGPKFARKAFHESLERKPQRRSSDRADIRHVKREIFAARQGTASQPIRLNRHWAVFVVRQITAASTRPLVRVRGKIGERLSAQHRRRAFAAFAKAYRARWTAKTDCRPVYVVQGCAQYRGAVTAGEDPLLAG